MKDGDKVKYKDLPKNAMFHAGSYLCQKTNEKECFIFQTHNRTKITDPDAIVEYRG